MRLREWTGYGLLGLCALAGLLFPNHLQLVPLVILLVLYLAAAFSLVVCRAYPLTLLFVLMLAIAKAGLIYISRNSSVFYCTDALALVAVAGFSLAFLRCKACATVCPRPAEKLRQD